MNKKTYEFDGFTLDLERKFLLRGGQRINLQPKVYDLLTVLIEKNGELVSRDELMKAVWKDTFVEETNLRFCIHALRKTLGKNADGKDYVETIPKRGYRFTAEISENFAETEREKETAETFLPANETRKNYETKQSAKRNLLIPATAALILISLIVVAAWQLTKQNQPKNALDFETLAVLPFESVGADDARIGLTDALITNLSKLKQLKVAPLASVRKFAEQETDAAAAGRELAADAVLTGTYLVKGENARVTVNLLRVADGANLWTETFSVKKKNGLENEDEIAVRTARLLALKIADAEDEKLLAGENLKPEAAQNYLAARKIYRADELNRRKEMIGLFEKVIEAEPDWALARAGFAEALTTSDQLFVEWEKAERIAAKTLELDPALAQPHTILGEIYRGRDWNWEKSEAEFKRAINLSPKYAPAYFKYSQFLRIQRRFAEAETQINKAIEIEPLSPLFYASLCELYSFDNKFDKALAACQYADKIEPSFWWTPKLLYRIYVREKMYAELDRMILSKLSPAARAENPLAKAIAAGDLRSFFQFLIDEPSRSGRENFVAKAALYAQLGEREKALENLEKALAKREELLPTANADSTFDSIRGDKRFFEIMRTIGLQK